jgi:hypothetical protein
MVAMVRIAQTCFVQHEEKGALIWQIGRNAPMATDSIVRRRDYSIGGGAIYKSA